MTKTIELGVERLLHEQTLKQKLRGLNVALVGHPASVNKQLVHSLDALSPCSEINITAAFGPQHGMRGDKQDNMIETRDYLDPVHNIPVYSLYGEVRRPTDEMMNTFDVLLFDVQDLGCRIYTYITTLLYLLEAAAKHDKAVWILDRPNPAGRTIEGTLLEAGWESFVGASTILMRHGLTVGEMAKWFIKHHQLEVELTVIEMKDYSMDHAPGFGWPSHQLAWVNPSPNAASLNMARCYAGTVLLEGTHLSEGRGTTIPLEVMGAPDLDIEGILKEMSSLNCEWLQGVKIRNCFFEPTFHKYQGKLCNGIQLHTDTTDYKPQQFKPFRLTILFLKAIRNLYPDYDLWRQHDYEYELGKLPFDIINGGTAVREWIDNKKASVEDMETRLENDENQWQQQIEDVLIY